MSKRLTLLPLAALLAALAPGAAHAATTCSYTSFGIPKVTISMTAAGDAAKVSRSGDAIQVNGKPCGGATVYDTNKIIWDDLSGADTTATVDLSGGPLWGIDLTYDAGPGTDTFNVWGTDQNDVIRIGSDGLDGYINLDVKT